LFLAFWLGLPEGESRGDLGQGLSNMVPPELIEIDEDLFNTVAGLKSDEIARGVSNTRLL